MKVYFVNGSPNSRKVWAVSRHLGIELDIQWLDFTKGETRDPAFLRLNPNGMVPVLVDGEFVLWESNAINTYLACSVDGQTLFPDDPQTRADITRWLCWELAHYNKALGITAFQSVAKPAFGLGDPDRHLIDTFVEQFHRFAAVLERHLDGRHFLVGDDWTLADYAVGHVEVFIERVPIDLDAYPNISAFYQRLRDNPHWAATAPARPEETGRIPAAALQGV